MTAWLLVNMVASAIAATIAVTVADRFLTGVVGAFGGLVRFGIFVITWTAVIVMSGMRGFTRRGRQLSKWRTGLVGRMRSLTLRER